MSQNNVLLAVPVKERVSMALVAREQQKLTEHYTKIASQYAEYFVVLAERLLAFRITDDLTDEDLADVDRLLYGKIGLMKRI